MGYAHEESGLRLKITAFEIASSVCFEGRVKQYIKLTTFTVYFFLSF